MRLATSLVGPDEAADVVSAAVLRTFGSAAWPRVDKRSAYLARAVVNEVRSMHRSNQRRTSRERRAASSTSVTMNDPMPEVMRALGRLPVRQRAVIYLTYWEDQPASAVAELLGISVGAVSQHLSRAKKTLGRTLR